MPVMPRRRVRKRDLQKYEHVETEDDPDRMDLLPVSTPYQTLPVVAPRNASSSAAPVTVSSFRFQDVIRRDRILFQPKKSDADCHSGLVGPLITRVPASAGCVGRVDVGQALLDRSQELLAPPSSARFNESANQYILSRKRTNILRKSGQDFINFAKILPSVDQTTLHLKQRLPASRLSFPFKHDIRNELPPLKMRVPNDDQYNYTRIDEPLERIRLSNRSKSEIVPGMKVWNPSSMATGGPSTRFQKGFYSNRTLLTQTSIPKGL